jgi:hypothetical protein
LLSQILSGGLRSLGNCINESICICFKQHKLKVCGMFLIPFNSGSIGCPNSLATSQIFLNSSLLAIFLSLMLITQGLNN